MSKIVVGLGEVLWDLLPGGRQLGGAPANFAWHAKCQGMEGYIVSALGNDGLGKETRELIARKGIDAILETVEAPTGTVGVTLSAEGIPSYQIHTNVAWDILPSTPAIEALARQTAAVCFGTLAQRSPTTRATIRRFLSLTPSNALRVFDINLRQNYYSRELIQESLGECNILKINDEETMVVADLFGYAERQPEAIAKRLLTEYKLNAVVLTCGAIGSGIYTGEGDSWLETPKVQVVDTVGAGDAFTGALVASLLKGTSIPKAHHLAVEVAAKVCQVAGAMPLIPEING